MSSSVRREISFLPNPEDTQLAGSRGNVDVAMYDQKPTKPLVALHNDGVILR